MKKKNKLNSENKLFQLLFSEKSQNMLLNKASNRTMLSTLEKYASSEDSSRINLIIELKDKLMKKILKKDYENIYNESKKLYLEINSANPQFFNKEACDEKTKEFLSLFFYAIGTHLEYKIYLQQKKEEKRMNPVLDIRAFIPVRTHETLGDVIKNNPEYEYLRQDD